jgi:aminoglycoside phosphotransferase (APT) family kinase protein
VQPPQELEPLVEPDRLRDYLRPRLGPGIKDLRVERHTAGHSNETFFLRAGSLDLVLRRPPRGAFLPTAHDVRREYRVLSALAETNVRVPRPVLHCEDTGVIGAPFYLMERVAGFVIRDRLPDEVAAGSARHQIGEELVDALVELHAVDWRSVGLEGFGKPEGYVERQVRRWSGQLALTEPLTRRIPELHTTGEWLSRNLPSSAEATIVHGDYKLDNVVFDLEGRPRLSAILDWEMSTLGDPLADLGWLISFWRRPEDPVEFVMDEQTVTRLPGFASREELIERYRERTGRETGDLSFYVALAVWKLAILLEGSYARHLAGVTDDPFFAQLEHAVPALASRAVGLIDQPGR